MENTFHFWQNNDFKVSLRRVSFDVPKHLKLLHPTWHIRTETEFYLSCGLILIIGVLYELMKAVQLKHLKNNEKCENNCSRQMGMTTFYLFQLIFGFFIVRDTCSISNNKL